MTWKRWFFPRSSRSAGLTCGSYLQPDSPLDFCFSVDSDINSAFKLDLVGKLFAIDTEPKTPFTAQVNIQMNARPQVR